LENFNLPAQEQPFAVVEELFKCGRKWAGGIEGKAGVQIGVQIDFEKL
jgi:hypothetical protein